VEEELRMAEARSWDFDCESTVYEWGSMVWMSEGESSEEEMLGFLLFTERKRGFLKVLNERVRQMALFYGGKTKRWGCLRGERTGNPCWCLWVLHKTRIITDLFLLPIVKVFIKVSCEREYSGLVDPYGPYLRQG
jgi:hypothetical protein